MKWKQRRWAFLFFFSSQKRQEKKKMFSPASDFRDPLQPREKMSEKKVSLMDHSRKESLNMIQQLQQSIVDKKNALTLLDNELLGTGFMELDHLKTSFLDQHLKELRQWNSQVKRDLGDFCESLNKLHEETKDIQHHLSHFESARKSLEACLSVASNRRALRQLEAQMRASWHDVDLRSFVTFIKQAKHLYQNPSWMTEEDERVAKRIQHGEKEVFQYLKENLKKSIEDTNDEATHQYCSFLQSLDMQQAAITVYCEVLKTKLTSLQQSMLLKTPPSAITATTTTTTHLEHKDHPPFETQELSCSDHLAQIIDFILHFIQASRSILEDVFSTHGFLKFLQGVEKEVDSCVVHLLDQFYHDNQTVLHLTTDTLSEESLREIDSLLYELARISLKCQFFVLFLHRLGREALESRQGSQTIDVAYQDAGYSTIHGLSTLSALSRKHQELMGFYVSLEHAYASISQKKAFEEACISLEESDSENFGSTFPDDSFFVLRKVISRSIRSCDDFAVCAVINFLSTLISTTTKTTFLQFLMSSAPFYMDWLRLQFSSVAQSNAAHESKTFLSALNALVNKSDRLPELSLIFQWTSTASLLRSANVKPSKAYESRCSVKLSWAHLYTDFSLCENYIGNLIRLSETEFLQSRQCDPFSNSERQQIMFQQSLLGLTAAKKEFQIALQSCTSHLTETFLEILDPFFRDFLTISFVIDDATFADYQVNDPFSTGFVSRLAQIVQHISCTYTPDCVNTIMDSLIEQIASKFEKCILKKKFSLLGGVQLETDIRIILNYLNASFERPFLSKFSRLMDIAELLCVSSVEEVQHLLDPLSMDKAWKLNLQDMKKIMKQRVDLSQQDLMELFPE